MPASPLDAENFIYSTEDVQAILAEARGAQAKDGFTRPQLFEIAAEMNISPWVEA